MKDSKINIRMKLASVEEISFMMSRNRLSEDSDAQGIQVGFANQICPDVDNDKISLVFSVRYESGGETVLESIYEFSFEVENLGQFVTLHNDQSITITHLMPHFLNVAVGTMRGILVAKTAGTAISKYPLPIIDINQLQDILAAG